MMSLQEEGFSLYLVFLKALPQGKKVLSQFGGDFFEVKVKISWNNKSFFVLFIDGSKRKAILSIIRRKLSSPQQ